MNFLFVFALCIITAGIVFLFILSRQKKTFGILAEKRRIYQDTEKIPGENLFAKTIQLVGRPDYLIKSGKYIEPVEKKKTKAPKDQYVNNNMQLMAYCLLVEENFGIRPRGGYLQYDDKEIKFAYTKEAEEAVRLVVQEILAHKKTNKEFHCKHQYHYNNLTNPNLDPRP